MWILRGYSRAQSRYFPGYELRGGGFRVMYGFFTFVAYEFG